MLSCVLMDQLSPIEQVRPFSRLTYRVACWVESWDSTSMTLFHVGVILYLCLYKPSLTPRICYQSVPFHTIPSPSKTMQRHPVIIHQFPQIQVNTHSSVQTSTMERQPTYEPTNATPSALTPRNRTVSNASSSSSGLSCRKLIRDRYKRPWQLMSVITVHKEDLPVGRSGGLKSPYPTPGRRNYDRV